MGMDDDDGLRYGMRVVWVMIMKTLVVRFARQMSPGVFIHAHFNWSEKWTERES